MTIADSLATRQTLLQTLAAADIPADHKVAILGGGTLINGRPAANVVVAIRLGDSWLIDLGAEHTAAGDNLACFTVKASW